LCGIETNKQKEEKGSRMDGLESRAKKSEMRNKRKKQRNGEKEKRVIFT
jgi:hypothetical protein